LINRELLRHRYLPDSELTTNSLPARQLLDYGFRPRKKHADLPPANSA
jgi:hypothetical protein